MPKPGIIIEEIRTLKNAHTNEISHHPDQQVNLDAARPVNPQQKILFK
jgi:hypothetical protein